MGGVAVVTDSNSGITQEQSQRLGVYVLPMPVLMDGETYLEDVDIKHDYFFERMIAGAEIRTSQPSTGNLMEIWVRLLETYDEIVHIPMSSGLSASCESAQVLSREYGGRVCVVDNQRISVTQRQSALDALRLAAEGLSAAEIKLRLENAKLDSSIYIMLDTLLYLKKGGRVTPAGAALGTILNIKPVLQIQGGKLDAYAKVRGYKQGKAALVEAMKKDFEGRFADCKNPDKMNLAVAYTYNRDAAECFAEEVAAAFPKFKTHIDPLSLSVSCHIGPGALALACSKNI
ncbi:MAG: DegV family protein [Defluviitaleaceae bacterium]|nr:DegV family protein [Defluviitaleaceae bacterium]